MKHIKKEIIRIWKFSAIVLASTVLASVAMAGEAGNASPAPSATCVLWQAAF